MSKREIIGEYLAARSALEGLIFAPGSSLGRAAATERARERFRLACENRDELYRG